MAKIGMVLALIAASMTCAVCNGATYYWIGAGAATFNWNNGAHWSANSGSTPVGSFPTAGDIAIFDGAGGKNANCLVNVAVRVTTLTLNGYTGTLSQGTNTLTVDNTMTVSSGTFTGSNQAMSFGSFILNGGTFTSTSSTLTITGDTTFGAGTFVPNGGTLIFNTSGVPITITGAATLNHVILRSGDYGNAQTVSNNLVVNNLTIDAATNAGVVTLNVSSSITVNGALTFSGVVGSDYAINTGTIYAKGDILLNAAISNAVGTGTIEINGTGNQNMTSTVAVNQSILPNVKINKTSGNLNLSGIITVVGPLWTYLSGNVVPGSSTVYFYHRPGSSNISISGTHTLNDVAIIPYYSTETISNDLTTNNFTLDTSTGSVTLQVNNSLTVNGALYLSGAGADIITLTTGTIYANGDVHLDANYASGGSTAILRIAGSGAQQMTGNTTLGNCVIPSLVIDKPSGTLTLTNNITVDGDWTFIRGTVNAGSSTIYFNRSSVYPATDVSPIIDGEGTSTIMTFNHIQLSNSYRPAFTLGGTLKVAGNMSIGNDTGFSTSASNYATTFSGNVTRTASATFTGNGSVITFDGAANQNVTLSGSVLATMTVAKTTGTSVVLLAPLSISAALNLTTGTITTTTTNILTLNNGASSSIGNAASYIDGPMRYLVANGGTRTLNLALGRGGAWRPAELTVNHGGNATSRTYTAELINSSAYALGYGVASTIQYVSGKRYWKINRNSAAGFSSASIKFYFDTDDEVANLAKLGVGNTTSAASTTWSDVSGGATTGSGSPYLTGTITTGSLTAAAFVSPGGNFALANLNVAGVNNPLPIELSSFLVMQKPSGLLFQWKTESELNNDYFVLERSATGEAFEELGRINGAGTTSTKHSYEWLDESHASGNYYYRLRQVDFDGTTSFSKVIRFESFFNDVPFVVYPVPLKTTTLYFNARFDVRVISYGAVVSLHHDVDQLDTSHWAAGLYLIVNQYGTARKVIVER